MDKTNMSSAVLHGTVTVAPSSSASNERPSFESDESLNIYIEDISQVSKTENAQEHSGHHGSILLGTTKIGLARDQKFPFAFECSYDPTKASNGQFDQLCEKGLIVVGAEIDADGREMTTYWLKAGKKKFEQNIQLTLDHLYQ